MAARFDAAATVLSALEGKTFTNAPVIAPLQGGGSLVTVGMAVKALVARYTL